ncbi:MAG: serpin family protein [Desulfovibrionaceae bacterium]|nr:serpin family protein [Desulfovibrionaceae bacterium]
MKKTLLLLSAASLLSLQACGGNGDDPPPPNPVTTDSLTASSLPRVKADVPAADAAALRDGNTAFATDLYKTLGKSPNFANQNLFFSPFSISEALAMTYAGAKGGTASELQSAMHFTLPDARLHAAFDALDLALTTPRSPERTGAAPLTLNIANSMWGEATLAFEQPFLDTLATDYGAGIYRADFIHAPDTARTTINDWVAQKTADKIQNLLPSGFITDATRLVLVNAVYFNARWSSPFSPDATAAGTFHGASGDTPAQMMKETGYFAYGAGSGWRAIALPYDGGLTFTAILPDNLSTFESSLNAATLASIDSALQRTYVALTLPRFNIPGATFSVKSALQSLGISALFSPAADLTGISSTSKPPLYVGDVAHQAYISVDEKGTEAAAATAVGFAGATQYSPQPVILTIDKPFVFLIRDNATGAILFLGRYVGG